MCCPDKLRFGFLNPGRLPDKLSEILKVQRLPQFPDSDSLVQEQAIPPSPMHTQRSCLQVFIAFEHVLTQMDVLT